MDNEKFESFTRSISGVSKYSDAYEDFDEEIGTNIKMIKTNDSQEILNNNKGNNENIIKKYSSIEIKKDFLPIPENTNENSFEESQDVNKIKSSSKPVDEEVGKENNNISNENNIFNINKEEYINNINNLNNSKKIDEDLYSIKKYSNDISYKYQDSDTINTNNIDKSDIIIKKLNTQTFDNNLQPLDSIENENDIINNNLYLNINTKKKDKPVNKNFKKFNSVTNIKNNLPYLSSTSSHTNTNITSKNSKKSNRYHPYFDIKNILKHAAVLNGKKSKNLKHSLIKSKNLSNDFNINSVVLDDELPINNIKFENIRIDEINVNFLNKHLRRIEIDPKFKNSTNKYIKTLYELQNFYIDDSQIWVIKLNPDGHFLAVGCKSGKIKILEIMGYNYFHYKMNYDKNNILEYLNFINEVPYKTLEKHKSDIIDLSWSRFYPNLLISASFDHYVYMWDISQEGNNCLINEYLHDDIVTSVHFNPQIRNTFISGCLDTFVRVWEFNYFDNINNNFDDLKNLDNNIKYSGSNNNILSSNNKIDKNIKNKNKKNKKDNILDSNKENIAFNDMNNTNTYLEQINKNPNVYYFNIEHKITALSYFPDGSKIGIGTEKGRIYVYNTFPTINYNNNFFVSKKKFGIFHGGKKVTSIQFIDKIHAIVSTSDSLIRLVDMSAGRIIYQYKGYVNKNSMTRGYMDLNDDVIIVGGEDGYCYLWNLFDKENTNEKNINYECFKPFAKELIECSIIAHENCYVNYMQKILKLTNKILILSIIINGTSKGRLEILLNIDEPF